MTARDPFHVELGARLRFAGTVLLMVVCALMTIVTVSRIFS